MEPLGCGCGDQARELYIASLEALTSEDNTSNSDGDGGGQRYLDAGGGDAILTSMFLIATAVVPTIYNSNDHIDQASDVLVIFRVRSSGQG